MKISPTAAATPTAVPTPPARWAQWWTSPLARFDYASGGRVQPWSEAWLPADRGVTGAVRPNMVFGGGSEADALVAARSLAAKVVDVSIIGRTGRTSVMHVNPAIAVLRDARAGVWWLAQLRTTIRSGDGWIEAPHTIDGAAFEGRHPFLRSTPRVFAASSELVAVVGRDAVVRPGRWTDAPDDSRSPGQP